VIAAVRGSVVDVSSDERLPPIYSVLRSGVDKQIVIEAPAQPDSRRVRGIALMPAKAEQIKMDFKDFRVRQGAEVDLGERLEQ